MNAWRRQLSFWRHEKAPDWTPTWFLAALDKLGCLLAGHEPERDQCGRPDHDFCLWCMKSMPNAAEPVIQARLAARNQPPTRLDTP